MTNSRIMTPQKIIPENHSVNRLAIFPLPIFLLGGGMQRLRIFEPKYLTMIASAAQGDGFVISVNKKSNRRFSISDWGTHVKIVDFNMGDDGVLVIDVIAERLVNLTHVEQQTDGVLVGEVKNLPHWSCQFRQNLIHDDHLASLPQILKALFDGNAELSRLYQSHYFNYSYWVCARLLEIVPLSIDEKEAFIKQLDFTQLTELLSSVCEKEMKKK